MGGSLHPRIGETKPPKKTGGESLHPRRKENQVPKFTASQVESESGLLSQIGDFLKRLNTGFGSFKTPDAGVEEMQKVVQARFPTTRFDFGGTTPQDFSAKPAGALDAPAPGTPAAEMERFNRMPPFTAQEVLPESVRGFSPNLPVQKIVPPDTRFGPTTPRQPLETVNVPIGSLATGAVNKLGEFLTGDSLMIMGSLGLVGAAAPAVGALTSLGFGAGLLVDVARQSPEFVKKLNEGDLEGALEIAGGMGVEVVAAIGLLKAGGKATRAQIRKAAAEARARNQVRAREKFSDERGLLAKPDTLALPEIRPEGVTNLPGETPRPVEVAGLVVRRPKPAGTAEEVLANVLEDGARQLRELRKPAAEVPETVGAKAEPVVEEAPATVNAQLESLKKGTVSAVMLPEGSKFQPDVPQGMAEVTVAEGAGAGRYIFNPDKISSEQIQRAAAEGRHGELLGHVQPKAEALASGDPRVVQARQGEVPLQESVVSRERVPEQAKVLQERFPEAKVSETTPAQVIENRVDSLRIRQTGVPRRPSVATVPRTPRVPRRPTSTSAEAGFASKEFVTGGRRQLDTTPARLKKVQADRKAAEAGPVRRMVERVRSLPTDFVRKYYDQFIDIRHEVKEIETRTRKKIPAEKNPVMINDLVFGGTGGRIEATMLDYGDIISAAEAGRIRPAVENLVELKGFRRAIQVIQEKAARAEQEGKRQEAARFRKKLRESKVVPGGYNRATIETDLKAIREKLTPAQFKEAERLSSEVFKLNRQAWDLAHREGLISNAVWKQGVRRGNEYIPLQRVLDVAEDTKTRIRTRLSLRQQQILKKLEGSERVNKDPIEASIEQHVEVIREAARNEAARTLVNLRKIDPKGFGGLVVELKPGEKAPKDMGTIAFYEKGSKRIFALPKPLADAMEIANSNELGITQNAVLRFTRRVFSAGATTANLGFSLPNVFRDIQDFATLSKGGAKGLFDFVRLVGQWAGGLGDAIRQDATYRDFLRSRAAFSTFQKSIDPRPFLRTVTRKPTIIERINLPGRVIRTIEEFNNALEEATKLTSFKRLRAQGVSEVEAAIETRRYGGSPDFAKKGTDTQAINLLFMFFNAQVQGVGRTFARFAENPRKIGTALAWATTLELTLATWNNQFRDEKGVRELDKIPEWERNTYFVIIRPEVYQSSRGGIRHRVWKVPKGYAGRIIFNPIETAIDLAIGEAADVPQAALDLLSDLSPISGLHLEKGKVPRSIGTGIISSLNPAIREPVEQFANLDTFRDRPIVPRSFEKILPEEQKFDSTSPTAISVGRRLGISPIRVEHAVEGFFAGLGEVGLNILDAVRLNQPKGIPLEGDEDIARTKILGPILRRFVGSAMDQTVLDLEERFYKKLDKSRETVQTANRMAETSLDRAERFLKDPERLALYEYSKELAKASRQLGEIRDLMRETARSQTMSDQEKKKTMRFLFEMRLGLLVKADEVDEFIEKFKKARRKAGKVPRRPSTRRR